MEKFLAEAQTTYFWLTIVVVPLVVGVGASFIFIYAHKPFDAALGRVSKTWKARAAKKYKGLEEQAIRLLGDAELIAHVRFLSVAYGQRIVGYLMAALISGALVLLSPIARLAVAEATVARYLNNALTLWLAVLCIYCLYKAAQFENNSRRLQAVLEIQEDMRQIQKEVDAENAAANAD